MRKWLEYIPFILIVGFVKILPRTVALGLGKCLGQCAPYVQKRRVSIARDNLQKAFPDKSSEEVSDTIDEMFKHLGISFIDMLRVDRYQGQKDLDRYFTINNPEYISEALELGRGCIALSGHVGFWEAATFLMPKFGFTTEIVAKPMRNTLVENYFTRLRRANGNQIINSRKGARGILKSLQKNHVVGLLLDQHIKGRGSVAAPFFGRPAHTTTIITQMAIRYQIPIVMAFSYRRPDNTYECKLEKMMILDGDLSEENILAKTTILNERIEAGIRHDISQWFWLHKRWRPCCEK